MTAHDQLDQQPRGLSPRGYARLAFGPRQMAVVCPRITGSGHAGTGSGEG